MEKANPFFKGLAGIKTHHTHSHSLDENQLWVTSKCKEVVGEKCSSYLATSKGQLYNCEHDGRCTF